MNEKMSLEQLIDNANAGNTDFIDHINHLAENDVAQFKLISDQLDEIPYNETTDNIALIKGMFNDKNSKIINAIPNKINTYSIEDLEALQKMIGRDR